MSLFTTRKTWYNVNVSNNVLVTKVLTTSQVTEVNTATITPGDYTESELITALSVYLNSSATFKITTTYDVIYNKFKFVQGASNTIATWFSYSSTMGKLLGFDFSTGDQLFNSYDFLYSTNIPNLFGFHLLSVVTNIPNTSRDSVTGLNIGNTIARIPVTVGYGSMVVFEPTNLHFFSLPTPMLDVLYIQLQDEEGNLVKMNGGDWHVTFRISWRYKPIQRFPMPEDNPLTLQGSTPLLSRQDDFPAEILED